MAHFAQLDENNKVVQVIVVNNTELLDENGNEVEEKGISFCQSLFPGTNWKQTSYNNNFRKNFAGYGYTYDEQLDAFIPPKPYDSWLLNELICLWYSPVPRPDDGLEYIWNEEKVQWDLIEINLQDTGT